MSKLTKLVRTPGFFFRDYLLKRYPPEGETAGSARTSSRPRTKKSASKSSRKRARRRHLPAGVSVEEFIARLNESGIDYLILRWFEDLPAVDGDIDLLVADEDYERLDRMFSRGEGSPVTADVFSVAGTFGGRYLRMPYYPPHFAREILASKQWFKGMYPVPSDWMYLLSLAYHALYHKERSSGLPRRIGDTPEVQAKHSYEKKLAELRARCEVDFDISLQGLHEFLSRYELAAPLDLIRKYAVKRPWLADFYGEFEPFMPPGEFTVFVVRHVAYQAGWLEKSVEFLRRRSFHVLFAEAMDEARGVIAEKKIRGGNWESADGGVSKNGPRAIIAAYYRKPVSPPSELKKTMPFLTNFENYCAKRALRELMLEDVRGEVTFNSLHSADDEREAWEYMRACFPEHVCVVQDEIGRLAAPTPEPTSSRPDGADLRAGGDRESRREGELREPSVAGEPAVASRETVQDGAEAEGSGQ
jgi:hypothetical protein